MTAWPDDTPTAGTVLVLADAQSPVEVGLLERWVAANRPPGVTTELVRLAPTRRRRPGQRTEERLAALMHTDAYLLPLRVVWSPAARSGMRRASFWDILTLGDPRDPDALRQRVILRRWPDRVAVVVGAGADAAALIKEHGDHGLPLVEWTTRRAWRTLDRAERALRGDRYKVPRFLPEEITSDSGFRETALRLGALRDLSPAVATARARHYLKEIAAAPSPFIIDLAANLIYRLIKRGYGEMIYDRSQVSEISVLGRESPLAFLPAHRSNLDRLSLQLLKWQNDLPPNHTAGGINMNFFPVGPLVRRTGVFFIRRTFKDNDLYKFVLRTYLDYLIENRFPLEWYLEGGRSRTGKLLPPRFGLLSYVVDSWRRGKSDDVMLVPVSIVYDQIQDLGSYADEARGAAKQQESFSWALKAIRSLRRRYGNIHLRFGEPISVAKAMAGADAEEGSIDLAKLGLEVMHRVGMVTPVSPAAVVSIVLLGAGTEARTESDLVASCLALEALISDLGIPTTGPIRSPDDLAKVVKLLAEHGNVSTFQGSEPIFYLTPDQALRASYYRNVVVHHFLSRALLEMALAGINGLIKEGLLADRIASLRDLLKFEFIFPEKEQFHDLITTDLDRTAPGWRESPAATVLARIVPRTSGFAIRPFLQAYLVVADELLAHPGPIENEKTFIAACLRRGEEYRLKGLITADGISTILFRQALALASYRRLVDEPSGRAGFAAEVRAAFVLA